MKPPLTNTFELIMQAGAFLDFVPPSRARSMVGTKLDEAILWLTQVDPDGQLTDEGQAQAGEPHFDKKQAASGIEALAQYAPSPEKQVRTAARLWRDTVRNLDHSNMIRATSEMRTIIARIEAEAGLITPKTDDMASNIVASDFDPNPFLDIMKRAEEQKKTATLDYAQAPAEQKPCSECNDTGWVPRAETGLLYAGRPFSSNYKPCPEGCDGGRGFSDPIPYDPKTGKIVATETEDDGA